MIVYEVVHITLSADNELYEDTNILYTYDEAYKYFALLSDEILIEYKEAIVEDYGQSYEEFTLEEIEENVIGFYYDDNNLHSMPYLYLSYDGFATDKIYMKKQLVMHFS